MAKKKRRLGRVQGSGGSTMEAVTSGNLASKEWCRGAYRGGGEQDACLRGTTSAALEIENRIFGPVDPRDRRSHVKMSGRKR